MEERRVVEEKSGAGDGEIEGGKGNTRFTFVFPRGAASEIQNFDDEGGSIFASTRFFEGQQDAAIGRLAGAHGLAG